MQNIIPWVISGLSLVIAFLTFVRNGRKDEKSDLKAEHEQFEGIKESLLKANLKLDQVCTTTNETRTDIKVLNSDVKNLELRVSVVENDLKNVHRELESVTHD